MIARDKLFHIAAGALVAAAVIVLVNIAQEFGVGWACLCGAALAGVGYEVQQELRDEGDPSMPDAVATIIGGAVVALLAGVF